MNTYVCIQILTHTTTCVLYKTIDTLAFAAINDFTTSLKPLAAAM